MGAFRGELGIVWKGVKPPLEVPTFDISRDSMPPSLLEPSFFRGKRVPKKGDLASMERGRQDRIF